MMAVVVPLDIHYTDRVRYQLNFVMMLMRGSMLCKHRSVWNCMHDCVFGIIIDSGVVGGLGAKFNKERTNVLASSLVPRVVICSMMVYKFAE